MPLIVLLAPLSSEEQVVTRIRECFNEHAWLLSSCIELEPGVSGHVHAALQEDGLLAQTSSGTVPHVQHCQLKARR